ncbi:MAG TPA: hypothetical protein ENN45_01450 [Bacteroidetes bacterium]|nr:hypothetical protein [Bacteroidota bacterium]
MKKLFPFVGFAIFLIFFLFKVSAQTATPPALGDGSSGNTYQIANLENLFWVTTLEDYEGVYFLQTANIDALQTATWFDNQGFPSIGNIVHPFSGTYNGDSFVVSNLYQSWGFNTVGFFGYVASTGEIENVILIDADISIYEDSREYCGGLVAENMGRISNCQVSGTVSADMFVGGLVGYNFGGTIENSSSTCDVLGTFAVGGLVGYNHGTVIDCSSSGIIEGDRKVCGFVVHNEKYGIIKTSYSKSYVFGNEQIGGFAGMHELEFNGEPAIIENCYAWGSITRLESQTAESVGSFIGTVKEAPVKFCYTNTEVIYENTTNPTTKGFIGEEIISASFDNNFFNSQVTGQSSGLGALPKTIEELQLQETFTDANWDFIGETDNGTEDFWGINSVDNSQYPFLSWQGYKIEPIITEEPTASTLECGDALENSSLTGVAANIEGEFAFLYPDYVPNYGYSTCPVCIYT